MAEHYTCDWCGLPMEYQRTILIDHTEFEMCEDCRKKHLSKSTGRRAPCKSPINLLRGNRYA